MTETAAAFFELYDSDPELRARVAEAEACYPGSLEIRDALAEAVLLPIARELGYDFNITDLRTYETRVKLRRVRQNSAGSPENDAEKGWDGLDEEPPRFWLLDFGWELDEAEFKRDK